MLNKVQLLVSKPKFILSDGILNQIFTNITPRGWNKAKNYYCVKIQTKVETVDLINVMNYKKENEKNQFVRKFYE